MTSLALTSNFSNAFGSTITLDALRRTAPAVFANEASPKTKTTYRFIPTNEVVNALLDAGFEISAAAQTKGRAGSDPSYAKHMLRFRLARERIGLDEALPECVVVNSHGGDAAYLMLIFACHHRRDSTCYPAYLQLTPRRGRMVTFSEKLTVRNGEAGARDHLILRHRSRRQGASLLTRCARCGRPAATALMLLMP